jgi:hypothetical protein
VTDHNGIHFSARYLLPIGYNVHHSLLELRSRLSLACRYLTFSVHHYFSTELYLSSGTLAILLGLNTLE